MTSQSRLGEAACPVQSCREETEVRGVGWSGTENKKGKLRRNQAGKQKKKKN